MTASHIPASAWTQEDEANQPITDDTTIEDEYEMRRIDSLTDQQRNLVEKHVVDQWEAVPSYFNRSTTDDE